MSSSEPIQPLFTRSPLILPPPTHSNQALFVTSPISTSPPAPLDEEMPTKHRGARYPSSAYTSTQSSPVFETLSFEKIKIPSSTTVSTDSEAFSSDYASHSNLESRVQSPSLISCLFQSTSIVAGNGSRKLIGPTSPHSRSSSRNGSNSNVVIGNGSKPILRRDTMSTSASEDNAGFGLGINRFPSTSTQNQETIVSGPCTVAPALKKKPSCLTFAVSSPTPRSQSNAKAGPSRSSSTSVSPTSSYAGKLSRSPGMRPNWSKIRGQVEREIQEDDDEDENNEEECMVDSPLPIPGHGESDEEDQGYVEDEEDGFTTDEDEEVDPRTDQLFGNWDGRKVEWNREYQLTTPKRRNTEILPGPTNYMTSTDDNDISINPQNLISPRGRKTSICINTNTKPSSNRCTRHRSPPPPIRSTSLVSAPPAARSPSAADLCRRRGSVEQGLISTRKGWKSDDSAFFPTRPNMVKKDSFKLPSASSGGCTTQAMASQGNRKASLPTPKLDGRCSTRSILKSSCAETTGQTHRDEPESQPMIRSSGENKIPPKTPPLTGDLIVPSSGNMLRRGSAPVIHETKDMSGAGVGRPGCLARSATGYEEEEMHLSHHQQHRGIRIV
ncbi:hypothetical protein I302_108485 [Kwoniella bestiolae CBS 10118]|uniref:Uncharacterized protein n=1 Tax=Kwoniella bestiolae CBS 10118 TaxID=1296100 RepID=A0A1B9FVL1_9TREE|nr:hypothetical protein I302_07139 [Kwoniella bestiolae CBS 10118]OCF22798.1 hypothetical protein I302_07139 [Kwoniella bestiolae CBS 10118]